MTLAAVSLLLLVLVACALFWYWRYSVSTHQARLDQLDVRVHVNGIRGKSTVTRLVVAVHEVGDTAGELKRQASG